MCLVEQCNRPHLAKGYCSKHWYQFNRRGNIPTHTRLDANTIFIECGHGVIILRDTHGNEKARTTIDVVDIERIKNYKWYLTKSGYAMSRISKTKQIFLHRLIMDCPDDLQVDHIDGNTLNNERLNLRICTFQQNRFNQKIRINNRSGITGVAWDNRRKNWRARIYVNNREIHIGAFQNLEEAINARRQAEIQYFGEFARKTIIK